ncbi:hypothetical protein LVD15_21155 [Fulvivirga maritima]|uniref:hypothetical protein n=1 Tax=Fulvivirga maritima TaxID=2904247 RepID=UPI001F1F551B|nr:hypothetical protein [Fulvivirga maritima]UII25786.1 hypothetical protein LVD15_21155 [Fulvivirga maritima]
MALLETQLPPTVIIDDNADIIYYHGELKPFLNFPLGEPKNNIMQMVLPDLRSRLRGCLYKAKKSHKKQSFHCALMAKADDQEKVDIEVNLSVLQNQKFTEGEAVVITFIQKRKDSY